MMKTRVNQSLISFLNNKPLFYDKIDYDIIFNAWAILKETINLPYVIHIVGTNGKGSTGRYLAYLLSNNGFKTLHYSSPHILKFNERIWIDGKDSSDDQLNIAHNKLQNSLPDDLIDKLTYFEYTTLVAIVLSDNFDYLVLEAGLGGEFDATNVVNNDLSLFTTMGLDHTEFLGNTIEKIATTKMRSCDNNFILGKQVSLIDVLNAKKNVLSNKYEIVFNNDIPLPIEAKKLPTYLKNNLKLVLNALKYLDIEIIDYTLPILFGRCQQIKENITIDVGHNALAATVLLREFYGKNIILVYNSYATKDYQSVLQILKPIIKHVEIININDSAMVLKDDLMTICNTLGIDTYNYDKITNDNEYLVFGSFKVVEEFLNKGGY